MAEKQGRQGEKNAKPDSLAEPMRLDQDMGDGRPPLRVALERPQRQRPGDVNPLWPTIRQRTTEIGFESFREFIDRVFQCARQDAPPGDTGREDPCRKEPYRREEALRAAQDRIRDQLTGVGAYQLLKTATEVFLLLQTGVFLKQGDIDADEETRRSGVPLTAAELVDKLAEFLGNGEQRLPYLRHIANTALSDSARITSPFCEGVLAGRVIACSAPPLLELIWSYWHEEGMLVQSISSLALRFQNKRAASSDPLASLALDPLRPMSNLTLYGKAVPPMRPADNRSKFIEAFHNLLYRCSIFFKEDDDTTVLADGFALLQSLKEVHLLLAEGAHNQFGDLPWTARVEMLIQQWLLARAEVREFLPGRIMVPYTEKWMGQVDAMKRLQGWTDVSVTHFRDLAVFGEQILLSVRYQTWILENEPAQAINWARYWRPEIQAYLHAYRAATGVDLTVEPVDTTSPNVHLRDRYAAMARRA